MERKKRFAQVGVGGRARFFYEALAQTYSESSEIVAFCDVNQLRLEYAQRNLMENFNYKKPNPWLRKCKE